MAEVTQFVNELLILPKTANARFSQLVVEVARSPTKENGYFSQLLCEIARLPTGENGFFSQLVIELPSSSSYGPTGGIPLWISEEIMESNTMTLWTDTEMQ